MPLFHDIILPLHVVLLLPVVPIQLLLWVHPDGIVLGEVPGLAVVLPFFRFDVTIVAVGKSLLAYYASKLERVISFQVLTEGNMSILGL